jgi:hypothetical protein
MLKNAVAFLAVAGLVISPSMVSAQSQTEQEVAQFIIDLYEYNNTHLQNRPDDYSRHGSLAFWSSGGLLQETSATSEPEEYDVFSIQPKHITVVTLVEGEAAVALFYAEGSLKPKGLPVANNYLVRVTAVCVKEDGAWKFRSEHYSAVLGGSGTSQTATITP